MADRVTHDPARDNPDERTREDMNGRGVGARRELFGEPDVDDLSAKEKTKYLERVARLDELEAGG